MGNVLGKLTAKLKAVADPNGVLRDKLLRTLATTAGAEIKYRIHTEGLNSDNAQIGTYSSPYLKLRQSKYNRTSDTKVIFSLTRQMENDFGIVASDPIKTPTGYGLGFKNNATYKDVGKGKKKGSGKVRTISNAQKAEWLQEKFGKVYSPTEKEKELLRKTTEQFINDITKDA